MKETPAMQHDTDLHIRALIEADAATYRAVRLRALREDPEAFGSTASEEAARPLRVAEERLRDPDNVTFGAFVGASGMGAGAGERAETLVGIATLLGETGAKDRHKTMLVGMFVAPEARGRGVGRALVTTAIAHARATPGVEQMHCTVVTTNTAARHLYASLGFVPYGVEPHALKVGDTYWDEELLVLRW